MDWQVKEGEIVTLQKERKEEKVKSFIEMDWQGRQNPLSLSLSLSLLSSSRHVVALDHS